MNRPENEFITTDCVLESDMESEASPNNNEIEHDIPETQQSPIVERPRRAGPPKQRLPSPDSPTQHEDTPSKKHKNKENTDNDETLRQSKCVSRSCYGTWFD